jgi:hypothetical protein
VRTPPPPRAIVPALAAVAGVVVAHTVDYALVFPQGDQRAAELHATGHGYWPVAVGAAATTGAVAVLLAAGHGARRARRSRLAAPAAAWAATRLLAWQVLAFTVMEAGERAMVGLPPSMLLHSLSFWLGVALQLPVAWLAARLLQRVEQVTYRLVAGRRRSAARPPQDFPSPGRLLAPAGLVGASPARPRAPPLARAATA